MSYFSTRWFSNLFLSLSITGLAEIFWREKTLILPQQKDCWMKKSSQQLWMEQVPTWLPTSSAVITLLGPDPRRCQGYRENNCSSSNPQQTESPMTIMWSRQMMYFIKKKIKKLKTIPLSSLKTLDFSCC